MVAHEVYALVHDEQSGMFVLHIAMKMQTGLQGLYMVILHLPLIACSTFVRGMTSILMVYSLRPMVLQ